MPIDVSCPMCGEDDALTGSPSGDEISIRCLTCEAQWTRPTSPSCPACAGTDLQTVPLAIVERSRGTQLSVVGIRMVHLCRVCDGDQIDRWQRNRPNPLMPHELPNVGRVDTD